jgi:hypothetical protein
LWLSKLTDEQKKSIYSYTLSSDINASLANDDLTKSETIKVNNIETALNDFSLMKSIIVHRGDTGHILPIEIKNRIKNDKNVVGEEFNVKTFISTSMSEGFKLSYRYNINVPKGKGFGGFIKKHSEYPHEEEFLMNRKLSFKITRVRKIDNVTIIDMDCIGKL